MPSPHSLGRRQRNVTAQRPDGGRSWCAASVATQLTSLARVLARQAARETFAAQRGNQADAASPDGDQAERQGG